MLKMSWSISTALQGQMCTPEDLHYIIYLSIADFRSHEGVITVSHEHLNKGSYKSHRKKHQSIMFFLKTDRLYIRDYLSEIMYSYDTQSDAPDWMTVLICRDRGASKIPFFYLQLNKKPGIVLSSNRRSSCLLIPLRGDGEVRVLLQVTMTITHQPLSGDAYVSAGEKQAWQSRRLYLLVSISRSDYMCLSQKDNFLRCMLER